MKNWAYRAIRTFIQAFVGTLSTLLVGAVSGAIEVGYENWWKYLIINLAIPCISAGLSAIMNMEKTEIKAVRTTEKEDEQ